MQQKQIDLGTISVETLKAMAYDMMVEQQIVSNNLALLNQELTKRAQAAQLAPAPQGPNTPFEPIAES